MKERPILFSGAMVRALLNGSKTQTRRVVKPAPDADQVLRTVTGSSGFVYSVDDTPSVPYPAVRRIRWDCPYGQPGDRLWVRETWRGVVEISPPGQSVEHGVARYVPDREHCRRVEYAATQARDSEPWRPSIHMPRWASRILLEIVSLRVERLQDISDHDAIAEGIEPNWCGDLSKGPNGFGGEGWVPDCGWINYLSGPDGEEAHTAVESYRTLWESINGPGSWEANPWVWVVEFKRVAS
jgi:hypothetical protein